MGSNKMKLNIVQSSNVLGLSYNRKRRVMSVMFRNNLSVYEYRDVPQHVYTKVLRSNSVGQTLNSEIKGKYAYTKVSE
jgi:KTSC domain